MGGGGGRNELAQVLYGTAHWARCIPGKRIRVNLLQTSLALRLLSVTACALAKLSCAAAAIEAYPCGQTMSEWLLYVHAAPEVNALATVGFFFILSAHSMDGDSKFPRLGLHETNV